MSRFGDRFRSAPGVPGAAGVPPASGRVWWPRLVTAVVWTAVGYSAVYWGLRLARDVDATARVPLPLPIPEIDTRAVARALGAEGAAAAAPVPSEGTSRFTLTGVLAAASPTGGHGVALIAVDGQKPRPFAVGATVDGQWVVQHVTARSVELRPAGAAASDPTLQTLTMPDRKGYGVGSDSPNQ